MLRRALAGAGLVSFTDNSSFEVVNHTMGRFGRGTWVSCALPGAVEKHRRLGEEIWHHHSEHSKNMGKKRQSFFSCRAGFRNRLSILSCLPLIGQPIPDPVLSLPG